MKIKVPVDQLEQGMYVAELDRPWVGTPFLFQGFLIADDEDLKQLRSVCDYVFVDDLQSSPDMRVQRRLREMTGSVRSGRVSKITVEFEEWKGIDRLRSTLSQLEDKRNDAIERLRRLAENPDDIARNGALRETRTAVVNLIEDVTADPKSGFWLTLLSENNAELGSHSVNVSVLAVGFAAYLGFDEELRHAVGQGAMLHDIGMSKVPAWLRAKASRLAPQEYALIRLHAAHGARMLADLGGVDRRILEIVGMHHERLDGSGYPAGLHGDSIPLHVRLVSICNRYEGLTRGRPDMRALAPADALQQLMTRADSWFDRNMVEAFIRWIGVYPLGSLVRLRNGYLCVVISTDPIRRLKPTVLLVRDPSQRPVVPRKTVNLEALSHSPLAADWSIDSIVAPASVGIDVRQVLLDELQLGRGPHTRKRVPA